MLFAVLPDIGGCAQVRPGSREQAFSISEHGLGLDVVLFPLLVSTEPGQYRGFPPEPRITEICFDRGNVSLVITLM